VRTADALRELPAISAAFADGRLSYTKVRALTRVAANHDEDLLLGYALDATAPAGRRALPADPQRGTGLRADARHVWERRSLTLFRDRARHCVRIVIELPAEEGELLGHAIDSAVAAGEAALGIEFATQRSGEGWRSQQADALVAIARVRRHESLHGGVDARKRCNKSLHGGAGGGGRLQHSQASERCTET
jgi:hypothetical protein